MRVYIYKGGCCFFVERTQLIIAFGRKKSHRKVKKTAQQVKLLLASFGQLKCIVKYICKKGKGKAAVAEMLEKVSNKLWRFWANTWPGENESDEFDCPTFLGSAKKVSI